MEHVTRPISKYVFISIIVIIIILSFLLIKPYISSLITGIILALIFQPVYKKLNKKIKYKKLSAIILIVIIILLIVLPIFFLSGALLQQALSLYSTISNATREGAILSERITAFFPETISPNILIQDAVNKLANFFFDSISNFIISIPGKIIALFITLFVFFYLLVDEEKLKILKKIIPFREDHKEKLGKGIKEVIYATLYGVVVTAIIQGAVGTVGLFVFKVEAPLLLGFIMTIFAMIPFIGTWVVWLPVSVIKLINGDLFNGLGLLLYGLFVVSILDNIIRPHLIGKKANIHPVIILLGIIGGIKLLGLIGLIAGPLILAILTVFVRFYLEEKT